MLWLNKGAQRLSIFKPPILKFSGYLGIEMMTQVSWFLKLIETAPVNRTEIFKPILHICPRLHLNSNSPKSEKIWIKQVNSVRFEPILIYVEVKWTVCLPLKDRPISN